MSVGGLFAYFGMVLPVTESTSIVPLRVPALDRPGLTLYLHDSDTVISGLFSNVKHKVEVHRLKNHYFGTPVLDRKYLEADYETITTPLSDTFAFSDAELQHPDFVYNYLKFEDTLDFAHKM